MTDFTKEFHLFTEDNPNEEASSFSHINSNELAWGIMKQNCSFHPTRTAQWSCSKCHKVFCPDCIIKRDKGGYSKGEFVHLCPKCNIPARWLGVASIIDPFWHRMPRIFAYPMSIRALILMIVISAASLIVSGRGFVPVLIRFAIWGVMLKYSFAALKDTAGGNLHPPEVNTKTISDNFGQVVKQMGLYFLVGVVFGFITVKFGALPGFVFLIFSALSIPAMIILLVTTDSFFNAINPVLFVSLMARIGWGYLLMYFFLSLLLGAPVALAKFIFPLLPPILVAFIYAFAQNYYTLVSYHLMGYVILQYHEKIGYQVDFEDFRDPTDKNGVEADGPDERILKEVTPLIKDGKLDEAVKVIQQYTSGAKISNKTLADRYYMLLKMTKRITEMLEHAAGYLDILSRENDKQKALQVFSQCRAEKPDFLPSALTMMKIAEWMSESGKKDTAIRFYNHLIKAYSEDPLAPRACFRAAQLLDGHFLKPEKSKQILLKLLQKYPESEVVPMAQKYLARL
jgi:tetratricopeptide (TPR) repeat protein